MMMIFCPELKTLKGITHGFFGREGGVSRGIYASLNCGPGSGDDPASVKENRRLATEKIGAAPESLCTLYQIHSSDVITVTEPVGREIQSDAMVTNKPDITLGILTADCAPLLFADAKHRVIGAAHAGWKGALSGIAENTISAMCELGAEREYISATIGPCIGKDSYEVGQDFRIRFLEVDPLNECYFTASEKNLHFYFNLPDYLLDNLKENGIYNCRYSGYDTLDNEKKFFSYRRTTHRGEPDYGRQLSAIALTGNEKK